MINGKLLTIQVLPQPNNGLLIVAALTNGAFYAFVGPGSERPPLSEYDPNNWRDVQRATAAMARGELPKYVTRFPMWEALVPVPGTDAYDDDLAKHGPHPADLPPSL
jgi:hypothetical protein